VINEVVIGETIAGVLAEAITAAGRRLGASATLRGRRYATDLEIARWFETYRLTEKVPIPELPLDRADDLAEVLRSDEVQAVLHELLAVRLTDAPEVDAARVRAVFDLTLGITGNPAPFTAALFDYYDDEICKLVGELEGHEPALLRQIRSEAMAARMNATLRAIERHTAALRTRPDQQTEADFLEGYREHVVGHHGKLEPPDFDHRRRVPIDRIYVPPTIEVIGGEQGLPPREIDLWTLAAEIDRAVLLGDPGGGKTTAANVLLHYFAGDEARPIPFLVTLREFASADRSVVGYIEYRLETFYQCPAPPGLVDRLLLTGGAVVVFDGLDELLDTSRRAEMAAIVERFCSEYPLARMLVTSRVVGYDEARLDERQFSSYKLGSFGNEQVAGYVRNWFFYEEDRFDHFDHAEAQRSVDAFLRESASVPELRANPMLLSLMCILYRGEGSLPHDRPQVYAECASLLFRKWDARRRIKVPLPAPNLLEGTLRHLAWWLFNRDQADSTATKRELIDETTSFLHSHRFESEDDAREAASEFVDFSRGRMWVFSEVGTTATGDGLYSFTHRTFLEYFAAEYLAYSHEKLIEELAGHVAKGEWEVVAELAVQMKDRTSAGGAQRIYEALIPRHRDTWRGGHSATLQFLARCLRSVAPPPVTVRELTREILDHLFFSGYWLVGDPDEPVSYLPLSWLLANCMNDKTVVRDEISTRIGGMVGSGDPTKYLNGLRLAVWLPYSLSAGDAIGNRIFLKSPMRHFWQECAEEYARSYSDAITKAAWDEIALRRAALAYGLITVGRALQMPGGLPALFLARGTGIFGMARMAYLPAAVIGLVTGRNDLHGPANPDGFAKVKAGFAAVGAYLTECSGPPWPTGPVDDWSEFLWDEPQESSVLRSSLDPIAYFGAAATLLMVAESLIITELPRKGQEQFGPFADLYPYIARRWGIDANGELADLPVPEGFRQLFRDWADNKVNFVGPAPAGAGPGCA